MNKRQHWPGIALLGVFLMGLAFAGCPSVGMDDPSDYSYDTRNMVIFNADWGVLPLPNDFLNPVQQAEIPVDIPGVDPPAEPPIYMNLPINDAEAAQKAQDLGYPVEEDSELTKQLVTGMNLLDGFVENFVIQIPFTKVLDMDSIVPIDQDGSNVDEANFFLFDATDRDNPQVVAPGDYLRMFNIPMAETYPYILSVRRAMAGVIPENLLPGHTYLLVLTGVDEEKGIKDVDGNVLMPDGFYGVFASETPYIAPDGSARNNLLDTLEAKQEAEGARQITNFGLEIWQAFVGEARVRNEVAVSYHFTVASNPYPVYFKGALDVLNANFAVDPIDQYKFNDDGELVEKGAKACLDAEPVFSFSLAVDKSKVNGNNVKLFNASNYKEVAASVNIDELAVTLTPDNDLTAETTYIIAVSNAITGGENDRPAIDQSYFGLTRVSTPLVADDMWLSPHLDSRIDTLIASMAAELFTATPTEENKDERTAALDQATEDVLGVLGLLEEMRKINDPHIPEVVDTGFVESREDLAMIWTFTTGKGCE